MTRHFRGALLLAVLALAAPACTHDETRQSAREDQAQPNDATITMNIQSRYFSDDTVKSHQIDVDTDKGVVTLSGTVQSDAARRQAETIAQSVQGVARVQNNLRVDADAGVTADKPALASRRVDDRARDAADKGEAGAEAAGNAVNASWITTKIQAQYFADTDVRGRHIDVTTARDGKVTLDGHVASAAERDKAVRIARETDGVRDVVDRLRIEPDNAAAAGANAKATESREGGTLGDGWITTKIESKYFLDGDVKGRDIDVTTTNGVVTLTGQVNSAAERRQAVQLARATDGVVDVRDQLRVAETAASDRDSKAADRTGSTVNDEWIETKIKAKYFLEDDLKAGDVNVDSARGVVTLQGRVPDAQQKQLAEQIAKETDGVRTVVNKLAIGTGGGSR